MKRNITQQLLLWKDEKDRLPLLIRGARQVGKTYCIEDFGNRFFEKLVKINFEQQPEFISCFTSLEPEKILQLIYALSGESVIPGKTLLFLDEIQECPNAILALRYFYEQAPDIHVIAAGSLLEFTMRSADFKMPVGRVQSFYLKPLSFYEFLEAAGKKSLVEYLQGVSLKAGIEAPVHEKLLMHLKEYLVLGGMPAVLNNYFENKDLAKAQVRQNVILETYRNDFAKYSKNTGLKHIQNLFEKSTAMISQHFSYAKVDPHSHSRYIKQALQDLKDAGLVYTVHASNAAGLPLTSTINQRKFKLLFLDVGLVNCKTRLAADILLSEQIILLHQGAIAEQFVGQELLAYAPMHHDEQLYYWEREKASSTAEVDYLVAINSSIHPIEVKSGSTGRLRSLKIFMQEKNTDIGIRVSQSRLSLEENILSVPLYMVNEIPRLIHMI